MKRPSSYLKMRVLGAIESAEGSTIRERIKSVSRMTFADEDGYPRQFTWRTISTWLYRYKKHGITGVDATPRADKGKTRKVTPEELLEAINQVKPYFRQGRKNKMSYYKKAIEMGILSRDLISQTSFYRFVKEFELLKEETPDNKRRMAFAMQYANDLWQGDTMFGPFVKTKEGKPTQTKLIAFIDDASRVITHGEFFFNENIDALIATLKASFYKRGIPKQIYVDNGSIYSSKELTLICARIGCFLSHTPVRDGAAKGKIERFFRTVRDKFFTRELDLSSLPKLNQQFRLWVEDEYNTTKHSALGMKPIDRFALDFKRIKFLPQLQASDEIFYNEETRNIENDNTFRFDNSKWECPAYAVGKKVSIRYDRNDKTKPIIVYLKSQRLGEAKLVNLIENANRRNKLKNQPKEN
ncbi:DDE-type integrase/transposase/recombinase [candidate division KSB1 bacterium]|nr:DDE-type integrase/transposase/recombinase [candidate division KSB1 bacterium]